MSKEKRRLLRVAFSDEVSFVYHVETVFKMVAQKRFKYVPEVQQK